MKHISRQGYLGLTVIVILLCGSCSKDESVLDTYPSQSNMPDVTDFPVVGTNQTTYFNNTTSTHTQNPGDSFYGQNANYPGHMPQYVNNEDGTITDMVTGLMWQSSFDHDQNGSIDVNDKLTYDEILFIADNTTTGAYADWRLPNIKEMYSLMMFSGVDISGYEGTETEGLKPFINTNYFEFAYGDLNAGERLIDMQCATSNEYVSTEVERMVFGVNFADGRIKAYGMNSSAGKKLFNYLLVRGNDAYGINDFTDNGDETITDQASKLMWSKLDNGEAIRWQEALVYAEASEHAGYSDWRLPDAKELESLVDYSRSPATTNSAAIHPLFTCTQIRNEDGELDYPWYWSNTTHVTLANGHEGSWGVYIAFGRSMGNFGTDEWQDVHGAGAQRSDPKSGNPSDYVLGHGPQGDAVRIYNYVRLVRSVE